MNYKDKTLFILGSNPALSLSELISRFGTEDWQLQSGIALLDQKLHEPAQEILSLGGTIKIARVMATLDINQKKKIQSAIEKILEPSEGKFKFGISNYSGFKLNIKTLGMELKKYIKEQGRSVRWVMSKEAQLSSVVVEQNGLLKNGIEIIITSFDDQILIAKTMAVQPFKDLSFRDYGRPGRDDQSGMLPPKLAQMLINLASDDLNDTILDPFCGSGTIVSEAMLMGYQKIFGSDISPQAISDTRKNINWLSRKHSDLAKPEIEELSATQLSNKHKVDSINAIATEPYLGPQRGPINPGEFLKELNSLYSKTLKEFSKILKPNGRIAMVWPVLNGADKKLAYYLEPNLHGLKVQSPLPEQYAHKFNNFLSQRGNLLYGRPDQRIWREIILLQKK